MNIFRALRVFRGRLLREMTAAWLCGALLMQSATAVTPEWWGVQGVLNTQKEADDYAAANLGQLKNIASKAAAAMDAELPGGAGAEISALTAAWSAAPAAGVTRDDYAAVTLGQLKRTAKPFYDRLVEVGMTEAGVYPWGGTIQDDYALANLGQLKAVFSFETDMGDSNQNGIPDLWELQTFGDLFQGANDDFDHDGVSNLAEYLGGTRANRADSDNDGISDGQELAEGTDPLNVASNSLVLVGLKVFTPVQSLQ